MAIVVCGGRSVRTRLNDRPGKEHLDLLRYKVLSDLFVRPETNDKAPTPYAHAALEACKVGDRPSTKRKQCETTLRRL